MKRVIVTGPIDRTRDYVEAARSAGWEPVECALLAADPRPFRREELRGERFDWICVTSAAALPWLESACTGVPGLRSTPCAAVGERTSSRLAALGLEVALAPATDSADLASTLGARTARGTKVLWPRGSRSDDLGRRLRERGCDVDDPVAYATRALEVAGALPEAEAVFFASPSAVRAWHDLEESADRRLAIAIGRTTFDALLQETRAGFRDTISLPQPTPEAFGIVLAHIDLETPP
jgi:uroporphyrinogen-III synthase